MNFEEAIAAVKKGNKVSRKAWLEKDGAMVGGRTKCLMYVTDATAPYRRIGRIDISPFVAQFILGGSVSAYLPTPEDKAATDFEIVTA